MAGADQTSVTIHVAAGEWKTEAKALNRLPRGKKLEF